MFNYQPFAILLLFVIGFLVLIKGRRFSRQGDWAVGLAILGLFVSTIYTWVSLQKLSPPQFARSWVWIRILDEKSLIDFGIFQDLAAMVMICLASVVALVLVVNRQVLSVEPRSERIYSALAISLAGLSLSWLGINPWVSFVGIATGIFGGFIALGTRWNVDLNESEFAARFGWENAAALFVAVLGACLSANVGGNIRWDGGADWYPFPELTFGAYLIITGLFLLLKPFPLLGWMVKKYQSLPPINVTVGQVFLGWTVFALLIRLEPQFRAIGVFPGFGWIALGSAGLTIAVGLFQSDWRSSISLWFSAASSFSVAGLAFAGTWVGIALIVGAGVGAIAVSLGCFAIEAGGRENAAGKNKVGWAKGALFAAAAVSSGVVGFLVCGGVFRWLNLSQGNPAEVVFVTLVYFLSVLLVWSLTWRLVEGKKATHANWVSILSPLFLSLLSLGVFWVGTASGGLVFDGSDRLMPSILGFFGEEKKLEVSASTAGFYWGALVLGLLTAFWSRRSWEGIYNVAPSFISFVANGYRVDFLGDLIRSKMSWLGDRIEMQFSRRFWNGQLLPVLAGAAKILAKGVVWLESRFTKRFQNIASSGVNVPAKALQLLQNGDLQWYLFFAIGSGVAVLIHYLNS